MIAPNKTLIGVRSPDLDFWACMVPPVRIGLRRRVLISDLAIAFADADPAQGVL